MKQAIIYTRFSPRPDADTSKSCEKQEERCRAYCTRQNYAVIGVFHDKNVSGKTLCRPGLKEAIEALKPGMILVCDTGDRLARDMLIELTIVAQVEAAECAIEYADGSATRSTPEGKLFRGILSAFAQYERERFAARTKAGLAKKKANGQWLGRAPVGCGYDKKQKKLVEHYDEKKTIEFIKTMKERYPQLNSKEITDFVNSERPPLRGKPWSIRTIRKILASK